MGDEWVILDLGLSLKRDPAWRELEARLPSPGPDCPPTLTLLDFVLGDAAEPAVERHLSGCNYCRQRFAAQRRAAARLPTPGRRPPNRFPERETSQRTEDGDTDRTATANVPPP